MRARGEAGGGRPARPRPVVSVVTVTYESAAIVAGAIDSVIESARWAGVELDVTVVDNASADDSVAVVRERYPAARIVINDRNVGFGAANNQAFASARGEHVLLLNPDARLAPDALGMLCRFLDRHPAAGAVAPAVRSARARTESAGMLPGIRAAIGHFLFVNRLLAAGRFGPWQGIAIRPADGGAPRRVGWAGGAALLLRASAVRQVGGFDPGIFLYGEDVDLGGRLARAGWETWLLPTATCVHPVVAGSESDSSDGERGPSSRWVDGLHDYYAARSGRLRTVTFDSIMALGLAIRAAAAAVRGDGAHRRRMVASAWRAARLAGRAAVRGQ